MALSPTPGPGLLGQQQGQSSIPANPYSSGITVPGGGGNTPWAVSWDPQANSYTANAAGYGQVPIYTADQFNQWAGMGSKSPYPQLTNPTPLLGYQQDPSGNGPQSTPAVPGGGYNLNTPGGGRLQLGYTLDPATGYYIPSSQQGFGADNNPFNDIIKYGAMAGGVLATGGGLAGLGSPGPGAAALGGSVDATSLSDLMTQGFLQAGAGYTPASTAGLPQLAGAGTADAGGVTTGAVGAAPGAAPAASTPGLAGLGGASGDFTGGPITSGLGTAAGNMTPPSLGTAAGGGGGIGSQIGSLLFGGGGNNFSNFTNLANLGGQLTNLFKNPGSNITQGYNTALGNAQPGINNLLQMMNPQTFYGSPVGQNLMASKVRDLNATASSQGRFGLGTGAPGGQPLGSVAASGAGIDTANLLNQYMAQQYSSALNANANAVAPLQGGVNSALMNQILGNLYSANSLNGLNTIFQNPITQNLGNSALSYLGWNGNG